MVQDHALQLFKPVDGEYTEFTTRMDLSVSSRTNMGESALRSEEF